MVTVATRLSFPPPVALTYISRMGERTVNLGARHQVRLSDLKPYHIITARCPFCRHTARMRLWQLKVGQHPSTWLFEVEERLRCMRCGSRGEARILVTVSEED
jgi:hypothetical protein